jgi:hypothetical protein
VNDVDVAGDDRSRLPWWIGGLFMIGSACFGLGSVPFYFENADPAVVAGTFFIGSIFFTSAAFLQWRQAVGASTDEARPPSNPIAARLGWSPQSVDWWATSVQLVGTVFFNISTFAATREGLDLEQQKRVIWAPDVAGSICFLVASGLAYAQLNKGVWPRSDHSVGWRINGLNLVGSIAFGAAAVAARYLTTTGEPANIRVVNAGTLVGAVCFFVGAALLPAQAAGAADEPMPA